MASHAATGGARIAPIELPASQKLFAVARNFGGNHSVTTLSFTGKFEGSETPRRPLKKANWPKVLDNPPPILAVAHPNTPINMISRGPNLSTSQPDTGYISA